MSVSIHTRSPVPSVKTTGSAGCGSGSGCGRGGSGGYSGHPLPVPSDDTASSSVVGQGALRQPSYLSSYSSAALTTIHHSQEASGIGSNSSLPASRIVACQIGSPHACRLWCGSTGHVPTVIRRLRCGLLASRISRMRSSTSTRPSMRPSQEAVKSYAFHPRASGRRLSASNDAGIVRTGVDGPNDGGASAIVVDDTDDGAVGLSESPQATEPTDSTNSTSTNATTLLRVVIVQSLSLPIRQFPTEPESGLI